MKSAYLKTTFYLTLAGSLFSGYLSAKKLFTNVCAFNEGCPYFLGYPACWYGFGMFFIMFIAVILGVRRVISEYAVRSTLITVSFIGILFAGRFVVPEIIQYIERGNLGYTLGLPTCAYGLLFYIIIFIVSVRKR